MTGDRRNWSRWARVAAVAGFFCLLLVIGLLSFKDYGISWDEPFQKEYGQAVYDYVTRGDERMLEGVNRYYGPAFELLLLLLERSFGLTDTRHIYLMRHLTGFMLFTVAVFFFYKLCGRLFGDWRVALGGCVFLVASPRIFAHAFFNPKDLPVLAFYVIGMFTLIRFLDHPTIRRTLAHAFACAVLIDIRIVGVMVPALTVALVLGDLIWSRPKRQASVRKLLYLVAYLGTLSVMVIALWPTLWRNPIYHFIKAFEEMSHYPLRLPVKYMGQFIWPEGLPWHYTSVWLAITTPVAYTACFIAGVVASIGFLSKRYRLFPVGTKELLLLLVWFFFPIVYLPASNAVVFDEWRHTFFVYPAFVAIALVGLVTVLRVISLRAKGVLAKVLIVALIAAIGGSVASTVWSMKRMHPYQNVYFNTLVGGIRGASGKFDLDYWGLSYREALENILRRDYSPVITLSVYSRPGRSNAEILPAQERERLKYLENPYEATYFLSHSRWNALTYPPHEEFFSVCVEGVYIMVVLRETSMDSIVTVGSAEK